METKEITTLEMRKLVQFVETIEGQLKEKNYYRTFKYDKAIQELKNDLYLNCEIIHVNSFSQLGFEKNDIVVPFINTEEGLMIDLVGTSIGTQIVSYEYCKKQLNDLSLEGQQKFLENLNTTPLEDYIINKLNISNLKFTHNLYIASKDTPDAQPRMRLISQDLKSLAGILSSQYKELTLQTFGSITFYISKETGLQELSFPYIHFSWEYANGGSIGNSAFSVKYNHRTNEWTIKQI